MKHTYCNGSAVFEQFTIKRKLGEGSFGTVYEIQREDFGEIYKAALKVITVPKSDAEFQGVLDEGMTQTQAEEYFYSVVEDIVQEFAIMSKFKGTANVVGYEDHRVIRHADGIGWDILIRMELLTPLLTYAYQHPFSRRDIIRLGIDMCRALELCQKYNVMLELSQDVGHRLRVHELMACGVQVSVRTNDLYASQYQCKLPFRTQLPNEIAGAGFHLLMERYRWDKPIRAVTIRGIDLVSQKEAEQLSMFVDHQKRDRRILLEDAVEDIRRRFGKRAISYAILMGDLKILDDGRQLVTMPRLMYQ